MTQKTHTLTYPGDHTGNTDLVVGGMAVVISRRYDEETDKTYIEVAKLADPIEILMGQK